MSDLNESKYNFVDLISYKLMKRLSNVGKNISFQRSF